MRLTDARVDEAHNNRLQRNGISVPLTDNLQHDAVVARPLKRGVRRPDTN